MEIVGANIKKFRDQAGLTLQQLAEKVEMTAGFLSQVETGKTFPSLSGAKKIADALDTTVGTLMGEEQPSNEIPIIKKMERRTLGHLGNGLKLQFLSTLDRRHFMEPAIHLLNKGAISGNPAYEHEGQEILIVLKGVIEFTLDKTTYRMEEGDSVYFDSSIKHSFTNKNDEFAEVLCVSTPPYF